MSDDLLDLDLGLRELTSLLLAEETLSTTLHHVATVATRCVTGGSGASITLLRSGSPFSAYATDDRVRAVDERQYELKEGPCIDALKTNEVFMTGDATAEDARWPDLEAHAVACGIRSILAVPMTVRREVVGSLNVYSERPDAFGPDAVGAAVLLAGQAAVSVANVQAHEECISRISQLQEALDSRVVIEQAKGVLMERTRCSADDAFVHLRTSSQHQNRKLKEIAAEVVATAGSGLR